jgi:hypothetical protein
MTEAHELEFISNQAIQAADKAIKVTEKGVFLVSATGVEPYRPNNNVDTAIRINTLSGLAKALNEEILGRSAVSVVVKGYNSVQVYGEIDEFGRREQLAVTELNYSGFSFDIAYSREEMIVALQSLFEETDDRDTLLQFISNVRDTNEATYTDDGTTQVAKASVGPASLANVKVPNPVLLKPYRTFREVEQPASRFIFRMNNVDSFTIYEADGGLWQNEAIDNIGHKLTDFFEDLDIDTPVIY